MAQLNLTSFVRFKSLPKKAYSCLDETIYLHHLNNAYFAWRFLFSFQRTSHSEGRVRLLCLSYSSSRNFIISAFRYPCKHLFMKRYAASCSVRCDTSHILTRLQTFVNKEKSLVSSDCVKKNYINHLSLQELHKSCIFN